MIELITLYKYTLKNSQKYSYVFFLNSIQFNFTIQKLSVNMTFEFKNGILETCNIYKCKWLYANDMCYLFAVQL